MHACVQVTGEGSGQVKFGTLQANAVEDDADDGLESFDAAECVDVLIHVLMRGSMRCSLVTQFLASSTWQP